jgi:hypothetical protein
MKMKPQYRALAASISGLSRLLGLTYPGRVMPVRTQAEHSRPSVDVALFQLNKLDGKTIYPEIERVLGVAHLASLDWQRNMTP